MKVLCISVCADPFSHTPMKVHAVRHGLDYSQRDMEFMIRDYEGALKSGQFSRIHIHLIDINPDDGEVSVLINRVGENPLKTKKIINPDAAVVREARLALAKERTGKSKITDGFFANTPSQGSGVFQTVPGGWAIADEVGVNN